MHIRLTKNNFIHFLYPFDKDNLKYHKSISISKLLPNNIKNKYSHKLVFGYLYEILNHLNLSDNFSNDIKKVIIMFYIGVSDNYGE